MAAMGSGRTAGGDYDLSDPINSFAEVVRRVALQPVRFFAELPRQGNLLNPLVFALICAEVSVILKQLLRLLGVGGTSGLGTLLNPVEAQGGQRSLERVFSLLGVEEAQRELFGVIGSIIINPILGAITLLISAGILHLVVRLVVGAENSGFKATFRVRSYSAGTSLVSWVPIIGLLASLYSIYLQVVGIREMHQTTTAKALGVFVGSLVAFLLVIPLSALVIAGLVGYVSIGIIALVVLIAIDAVAVALTLRR